MHLTVSTYDPYEDKDEFIKIFLKCEESHPILIRETGWKSKVLLILEYLIELYYHRDDPFRTSAKHGKESQIFH